MSKWMMNGLLGLCLGLAYRKIYSTIFGAGMMPGDESRMYYLYWEGIDSVNNVVMIAVEVQ